MQRHVAVILPTHEVAFLKPFAPPPIPQQNPKLLYSRFIRSRFIQDLHVIDQTSMAGARLAYGSGVA
ncbi:hypothetical protein WI77_31885 [Burkholderia ubonensis]|nr:hypothetical protein WI77_31885 [Burkholderia ubonensis]KVT36292.1 hypothetical protein WK48_29705 [Burkholderia ubonensis]